MADFFDKFLVPDWRDSWRFLSVQVAGVASIIGGAVAANPDLLLSLVMFLPAGGWAQIAIVSLVVVTMFVVPTLSRLWNQQEEAGDGED